VQHPWRSSTRWTALLFAAAFAAIPPKDALAQEARWEVNASGSRITYDSLAALNSPALGGLLEWRGSSVLGRLTAGVTGFQNAGWTVQGGGDVSGWITPSAGGRLHVELAGAARASRHSSGFDNYLMRADARLHWITPGAGAWAGLGAARSRNASDVSAANALVPNVGAWARFGAARLTAGYQTPELFDQRFHEASSALSVSSDHLDVTAFAGWRTAAGSSTIPNEAWGGATATLWLHPTAALLVSGGRYGPDVLQGLPGGTFVSLGFRLTSRRVRPVPESAARAPLFFGAESADAGTIGFRVQGARSVEVAGDWNDWTPEPLRRDAEGRWTLPAGLSPGIYRFNLRVDGMRWIVPDGVPVADDGFGGEVGILIVRDEP
jgi:hypothetical protein